jgi:predicted PurR-regulated permease PerM
VRRWLPFSDENSDELRRVFTSAARATLLGTLASAALQGTSIGLGLRLIGDDAPAFWGVVAAFSTLVPIVGNALVWVPATIVPLVREDYRGALIMLTLGKLIPALLDRVVRSGISRRLGDLHPMVTLVGVMLGIRLFGVVGVIVGPALMQTGIALLRVFEREYGLW